MKTLTCAAFIFSFAALAQEDVKNSKDHPLFPRLDGYFIAKYELSDNDTVETFFNAKGMPIEGAIHKTVITYQLKQNGKAQSATSISSNFQSAVKQLKPYSEYRHYSDYYAGIITTANDTWVHFKPNAGKGSPQQLASYTIIVGENPRVNGRMPGSPSKFAGSYRSLVGKIFSDLKELALLSGFNFIDQWNIGSGTEYDFNGQLSVSWYTKGNLIVALYKSVLYSEVDNKKITIILDVLEIVNVKKNQTLTVGVCQDAEKNLPSLAALVQPSEGEEKYQAISAWYFNPNTFQIDAWSANQVKCLPTGQD